MTWGYMKKTQRESNEEVKSNVDTIKMMKKKMIAIEFEMMKRGAFHQSTTTALHMMNVSESVA